MRPSGNIVLSIIIICLIVATGCTGNAGSAQPVVQANPNYQTVSYNATPVQHAQVNGVTLGYREFGSGEPVLMIQGFGGTMKDWNETFIGILASKYHVYIYDHRGMGNSSDNNATPTISLYADDAAGLMTALGYDSMHVYGVSMGSSTSQQLAINHPERVRKLILDSNAYSVRIPETKKLLGNIEAVAASPAMPEGVRREAQANLAWNGSWDGLSGIQKDVMLVVGTSDDLTPDAVSVRMAGQINGSWLVRFKGLPHVGSHYAPIEYGENALMFLGLDESPLSK
ncbi:MAG: alpha/beta hydrolase [Methanoregula sp.]|jgi:pimeloyl-ACP methyl ester carboxylesterase|nr:alpha/beta hydrolase [Methanoregula sp.]